MNAVWARARGRWRIERGRCPACASEAAQDCRVCLGYQGPFPAPPEQVRRWSFRFEASVRKPAARLAEPARRSEAAPSFASV